MDPVKVPSLLAEHDLLILPSWSENFGHVVLEALLSGLPVVASSGTPWADESGGSAVFAFSPDEPSVLARIVDDYATFSPRQRERARHDARLLGARRLADPRAIAATRELLTP